VGADLPNRLPQRVDLHHQQTRPTVAQVHVKKKVPPGTQLRRYSGMPGL
jgi:hypothetical protein